MSNLQTWIIAYLSFGVVATTPVLIKMSKINKWDSWKRWVFAFLTVLPIWPLWSIGMIVGSILDYRNTFRCAWCGKTVDTRDMEEVKNHVSECKKHPSLNALAMAYKEIDKLKSIISVMKILDPDDAIALREKCRIYEDALQAIESQRSNRYARNIAGEALDHFRCGTCKGMIE